MNHTCKVRFLLLAGCLCAIGASRGLAADAPAAADERMSAFREAKFGMFVHWGLYAIPARGEWVMNRSKIPVARYAEYAKQFNPVRFNAEEWVGVAKAAGMRYIVITAKHHDGFAMFGSRTSPYNIVDATPFKRDPLKELAAACRKEGVHLGFYYSQAQDWHHPGGAVARGGWDPVQKGDFDKYLATIALPQVRELLSGYGPVFSIWFDTPVQMTPVWVGRFAETVHTTQSSTLVNSRLLYSGRAVSNLKQEDLAQLKALGVDYLSYADRQIPEKPQWKDWETCMTLNRSWGYTADDQEWKSPETLVRQLIEIASKGGNFLLNVGPTAEGVIPEPSVKNLKAVGEWLKVNGEAIYGTDASPLVGVPGADGGPAWRCTAKAGRLYVHLLQWPAGGFELRDVKGNVARAFLLAQREKDLAFTQNNGRLSVDLPAGAAGPFATVLCLEFR